MKIRIDGMCSGRTVNSESQNTHTHTLVDTVWHRLPPPLWMCVCVCAILWRIDCVRRARCEYHLQKCNSWKPSDISPYGGVHLSLAIIFFPSIIIFIKLLSARFCCCCARSCCCGGCLQCVNHAAALPTHECIRHIDDFMAQRVRPEMR